MVITKSFNLDINTPWKAPTLYIKQGDVDSRKLQATIRKDGTNYSIPGDVFATFRMHKPDDTFVTQDCTISGSVVSVVMDAQCATAAGHGKAEFVLQTASEVVSTFLLAIEILPSAVTDGDIESRDALGEYRTILDEMLRVKGAPLVANTAADMTDTDRVYVYTGSEVGYVNGDWYYYDGANWMSGGVYNSQGIGDQILNMIYNVYPTEADSGQIASFKDGADSIPVKSLAVNIQGSQGGTGTPAPDNICPITYYSTANIYHRGKNLLLPSNFSLPSTQYGVTLSAGTEPGTYVVNGTATGGDANFVLYYKTTMLAAGFHKLAGQVVKLSGCPVGGAANTYCLAWARCGNVYDSSSQFANDTGSGARYVLKDFTDESGSIYLRIHVQNGTTVNNLVFKPMVTLDAETDQTYAPPAQYDTSIALGDRLVYSGVLNVETGLLTATWRAINMGLATWSMYTSGTGGFNIFRCSPTGRKYGTDADGIVGLCDCYEWTGNKTLATATGTGAGALQNKQFSFQTTSLQVCVRDDTYATEDAFKAAMDGHYLVYEYDTPYVLHLTPTEVRTVLGDNNIWADTGNVNVIIRADIAKYIEERLA